MPLFKQHLRHVKCMPWGAVAGAVISGVAQNAAAKKAAKGGAGTSETTKNPWAEAAPWMQENIAQGQTLQGQLQAEPFSELQKQAYANQYGQSDYMRGLVPSLLGQMQAQPAGFDRNNPTAKRANWDWGGMGGLPSGGGGALGGGGGAATGSMAAAQQRQDAADAARAAAAAAAAAKVPPSWSWDGKFNQQGEQLNGTTLKDMSASGEHQGAGGFGQFRYGMATPERGTDAYRDQQEYFLRGGQDPNNLYGRAETGQGTWGGIAAKPGDWAYNFTQNFDR